MRKLFSILLLVVFGLPSASSLFALTPQSEASLPACCRRAGKHHCMSQIAESTASSTDHRHVSVLQEKCPCCPAVLGFGSNSNSAMSLPVTMSLPALQGQSAIVVQAEVSQRIALERARHKRGPPSLLSL